MVCWVATPHTLHLLHDEAELEVLGVSQTGFLLFVCLLTYGETEAQSSG